MGRTRTATLTLKGLAFSRMVALQFLARLWNARRAAPAGLQGPWRPRRPSSALCARQGAALGTVSAARVAPSGFEPRTPADAAHFAELSKSRFICRLVALVGLPRSSLPLRDAGRLSWLGPISVDRYRVVRVLFVMLPSHRLGNPPNSVIDTLHRRRRIGRGGRGWGTRRRQPRVVDPARLPFTNCPSPGGSARRRPPPTSPAWSPRALSVARPAASGSRWPQSPPS